MDCMRRWLGRMTRVKTVNEDLHQTELRRCLGTVDITLLGVGHMIGAGIYVLTGTVVAEKAGASAVLSFLLAGFAALLSALCYAEFGARIPKAGSAYSYVYVTVGELWGFLIGWNIVLEHMIGAASVARAWSGALDALFNNAVRNGTMEALGRMGQADGWLSEYPDMVATGVCIIAFTVVLVGAKASVNANSAFTVLNGVVLTFIVVVGFTYADGANWTDPSNGGFFPYGFGGTLSGAATCFFAYIGFEGIAIAGEEARDPEHSIPRATVLALAAVTLLYLLATAALTLMVPYSLTNTAAAFPSAFHIVGADWAKYIVGVGTLLGISTSLLGSAFSLPRSVYAMAQDGLLFSPLAYVSPKTQTPVVAMLVFGALSAIMALLFEIATLVEFMSIGTLFGYTIVAASIIILRYQPVSKCQFPLRPDPSLAGSASASSLATTATEQTPLSKTPNPPSMPSIPSSPAKMATDSDTSSLVSRSKSHDDFGRLRQSLRQVPVLRGFEPGAGVQGAVVGMVASMTALWLVVIQGGPHLMAGAWWAVLLVAVFGFLVAFFYLVIVAHEQNDAFLTFQIPLVPLLPSVSMGINIALMLSLGSLTWLRLLIWITIGLLVYFSYGIHHSRENAARAPGGYGTLVEYRGEPQAAIVSQQQQPERKAEEGVAAPPVPESVTVGQEDTSP